MRKESSEDDLDMDEDDLKYYAKMRDVPNFLKYNKKERLRDV